MKKNIYRVLLPILLLVMAGFSNTEDINSPVIAKADEGDVSLNMVKLGGLKRWQKLLDHI